MTTQDMQDDDEYLSGATERGIAACDKALDLIEKLYETLNGTPMPEAMRARRART